MIGAAHSSRRAMVVAGTALGLMVVLALLAPAIAPYPFDALDLAQPHPWRTGSERTNWDATS